MLQEAQQDLGTVSTSALTAWTDAEQVLSHQISHAADYIVQQVFPLAAVINIIKDEIFNRYGAFGKFLNYVNPVIGPRWLGERYGRFG